MRLVHCTCVPIETHLKDMYCTESLTLTIFLSISIFLAPERTLCPIVPATQYPGMISCRGDQGGGIGQEVNNIITN